MANLKISGLTALSAQPASGDLLPIVDIDDTTDAATGTTKKITYTNILPDSSATVKGIVEEATQAETDAGTAAGGTSARLFVNPATVRAKAYHDYIADAGSTDAYAITVSPTITAYATGQIFTFKANTANTGACTLAVSTLAAITIKKNVSTDLITGDILANQIVTVVYDGTNMQLLSSPGLATSGVINSQVYTSSTTWTKPSGITFVKVVCIGGGGGGGGGEGAAAATLRMGGSGGGGGAIAEKVMRASDVSANVSVTVGDGGAGGAGGSSAAGSTGVVGGNSSFGSYLTVYGGGRGAPGDTAAVAGGGGGGTGGVGDNGGASNTTGGVPATTAATAGIAGQGGGSSTTGTGASAEFGGGSGGEATSAGTCQGQNAGSSLFGGAGGGGGAGVNTSNNENNGGQGGVHQSYTAGGGGVAGAANGGAAGAGTSRSGTGCGDGGGGGGSQDSGTGGAGGAGGAPGGGGGGGAGGTTTGGAGAAGGVGEVRIFCW